MAMEIPNIDKFFEEFRNRPWYIKVYWWFYRNTLDRFRIYRIRNFFVFGYQKITRGFSDDICWNLSNEISRWILPRLKRYKELSSGIPYDLSEEEWENDLDTMIKAFSLHSQEYDDGGEMNKKEGESIKEWIERSASLEVEIKEGLELFVKYYRLLWD